MSSSVRPSWRGALVEMLGSNGENYAAALESSPRVREVVQCIVGPACSEEM